MRKDRALVERTGVLLRAHPIAADAVLASGLAAAVLVSLAATYDQLRAADPAFRATWTAAVVASLMALTLPLAWRRRFPNTVAGIVVAAFLVGRIVVHVPEADVSLLAGWLTIYSVAVHGKRPFQAPVLAACFAAITAELVREIFFSGQTGVPSLEQSFTLLFNLVELSLPLLLGTAIRRVRERQRELADQTVELQVEREENARQAVFAERVRIARELHDVVAHHVSVIGVQAAGARRVMERQPGRAAEAMSAIEASSRQAVVELHRLLGFLRRAGEGDDLAPQPGLAQLGDLVAEAAKADLRVHLTIEGEARLLSPTIEVSAYRIVQEALTNTRKHAGAAAAFVRICYGTTALDIEVLDDGAGWTEEASSGRAGHGLIGMRERAALHGGHLRAGPRPEGGFGVHATFPLTRDAA